MCGRGWGKIAAGSSPGGPVLSHKGSWTESPLGDTLPALDNKAGKPQAAQHKLSSMPVAVKYKLTAAWLEVLHCPQHGLLSEIIEPILGVNKKDP